MTPPPWLLPIASPSSPTPPFSPFLTHSAPSPFKVSSCLLTLKLDVRDDPPPGATGGGGGLAGRPMLTTAHSRHLVSTRDLASKSVGAKASSPSIGTIQEGATSDDAGVGTGTAASVSAGASAAGGEDGRNRSVSGGARVAFDNASTHGKNFSAGDAATPGGTGTAGAGVGGVSGGGQQDWAPSNPGGYVPGHHPWLQLLAISGVLIEGETALWRRMLPTESAEDIGGAAAALEEVVEPILTHLCRTAASSLTHILHNADW